MCGIAGFYQTEFDFTGSKKFETKLKKMKHSLNHRGPDENHIFLGRHAGFAHTRLSIIDLKNGSQPMTGTYFSKKAVICYNGEIYNTRELKKELEHYPLHWHTTSDTEVILNGYLAEGPSFVRKLNGIFAFAIYDTEKDTLFLFRDRLGVKPLFYTQKDGIFVFASEPKALFAYGVIPKADRETWGEIFGTGPAHTPGHGVFAGIHELLPGHMLTIEGYSQIQTPYWKLQAREHTDSDDETREKTSFLVYDSVKRQMISDIPICTFLSGGLDSSLVSAICARELKKEGKILNTYSFEFLHNAENFKANAFQSSLDRPFAEKMAEHCQTHHTVLECDNQIQADYLYKAVDARDLPCMADVESSLLYFCSQVAKNQRVALTGECADEIFGGYPWFHKKEMFERDDFPWSHDMQIRTCLLKDEVIKEMDVETYAHNAYETSIRKTPRLAGESREEARRRELSWLNLQWFMMTLLNRMDRTSMYSGLEARVPFADHRILEYVFNIPWRLKCENGRTKSLLIFAAKDLLPPEVLYRKKSPYPKTYDPNYEQLLKSRFLEILQNSSEPVHTILDKKKSLAYLNSASDYGKPWYGQLMAGPQMLAYILQINYWMKAYHIS